jgi:hypothetical protein
MPGAPNATELTGKMFMPGDPFAIVVPAVTRRATANSPPELRLSGAGFYCNPRMAPGGAPSFGSFKYSRVSRNREISRTD